VSGYIRSLQMSQIQLFAYVEGKESDAFFYGKLCEVVNREHGILRQLRSAKELPTAAGGKNALLEFHSILRQRAKLISTLNGKKTGILFFVDKDIDDLTRKKCRSQHVIYTNYYDVQNHITRSSKFLESVSSAASVDQYDLEVNPKFSVDWAQNAALRWKDWVKLCIFSKKHNVHNVSGYRVMSEINVPLNGSVDAVKYDQKVAQIKLNYQGSEAEFNLNFAKVDKLVSRYYARREQDKIFKGKWYAALLEMDLRDEFRGRDVHIDKFSQRVNSALAATIDFSGEWILSFLTPIRAIAHQLTT